MIRKSIALAACLLLLAGCAAKSPADPAADPAQASDPAVDCVLRFHSFDGGGPSYSVSIADESLLSVRSQTQYSKPNHEELDGAGYDVIYTFTGLRPGMTTVAVSARSSIGDNFDAMYEAVIAEDLTVTLTETSRVDPDAAAIRSVPMLNLRINEVWYPLTVEQNAATDALIERLNEGSIFLELADSGSSEKVGTLPWALPTEDQEITTQPGDVILYAGNQLAVSYGENICSLTRIGRIEGVTREELLEAFGEGSILLELYVEWSE